MSLDSVDSPAAPPEEGLVVFPHISKTAGNTLFQVMTRQYGRDGIYKLNWKHLSAGVAELRRRADGVRAVGGHVPVGVHEDIGRPCTYVTMLRDPVERLISHYYYSLHFTETAPHHEMVVSQRMTLREYMESPPIVQVANNGQTRMLGCGFRSWQRPTSDDMLDVAKRNINERFAVVGLVERFDESLLLMKHALGWDWPLYSKANVNPERPSKDAVPDETLRIIAERNRLDAELYRYAEGRLTAAIEELGPSFSGDLRRFRGLNAA